MSWDDSSSSDDFFFFGGSSGSGGSWLGVLIALILIGLFIWWLDKNEKAEDRQLATYIAEHQCKIDSFIGGDKTKRAHYQCDNGQFLDFDLRKAALQKGGHQHSAKEVE